MKRAAASRLLVFALVAGGLALAGPSCGSDEDAGAADAAAETREAFVAARPSFEGSSNVEPSEGGGPDGEELEDLDAGADADAFPFDAYLDPGAPCEDAGRECRPGYACCPGCCLAGLPPVCAPLANTANGAACPLPDLSVVRSNLLHNRIETVEAGTCELEEQCLSGPGLRRVLRFDVWIANRGSGDLVLGAPDASDGFMFAPCHGHFHFTGFASYALVDDAGAAVVVGRKQAFCAQDSVRVDPLVPIRRKFDCERQGITRGWADVYASTLPCQWLDVTDVPPGTYRLEVEVNPSRVITELDYTNNRSSIPITIP